MNIIYKILIKNKKSYGRHLFIFSLSFVAFFSLLTFQNFQTASSLENSAASTGIYDAFVITDSSSGLPTDLTDKIHILGKSQTLFSEEQQPYVTLWNDFSPVSIEMIEGRLPSREGEVSVGLNTALVNDWTVGIVISSEKTPLLQDLTVTGIHSETGLFQDGLLAYQGNQTLPENRVLSTVYYVDFNDSSLVNDIQKHQEQFSVPVQLSPYGMVRWGLPNSFSQFIRLISLLCLAAVALLQILDTKAFLHIIHPETRVLHNVGISLKSIQRSEFILMVVIPGAFSLILSIILSVIELWLWRFTGIEKWMIVRGVSIFSFFFQILLLGNFSLLISSVVVFGRQSFRKWIKKKGTKSEEKNVGPKIHIRFLSLFRRKLFGTRQDKLIVLFLALLFLFVPLVVSQSSKVLSNNEHPLIRLQDRDIRVDMFFENRDSEEIQTLFKKASVWSESLGRAGYLDLTGAVPLKIRGVEESDGQQENGFISTSLTVPLNEELYRQLIGELDKEAEVIYFVTPSQQPLGILRVSKSVSEYGAETQIDLDSEKIEVKYDNDYTMVIMDPNSFRPDELNSSYSNVLVSLSWFMDSDANLVEELNNSQELIKDWMPSTSRIYLVQNIRIQEELYHRKVLWITCLSLVVIAFSLALGMIMLFRQKMVGLRKEIFNAERIGISKKRIRQEIRKNQIQQILIAMIPSLCIGLYLWMINNSIQWLATGLLSGCFAWMLLMLQPLSLNGEYYRLKQNEYYKERKQE